LQKLYPEQSLNVKHYPLPTDDPLQRKPDLKRARETLGWSPKVLLEDGLPHMIQWLKTQIDVA
jgi:UDP-glucuronate decarboxylase